VGLSTGWGLWHWTPTLRAVPYLDDATVHEQMVRFAATRLAAGHSPYTSWFPYLGLGSPQFLHYQGLGATLAGALGTGVSPDAVFRWSLYLLLAAWPLAIYLSARLFSLSPGESASAAVLAPFLVSVPQVGYEAKAYIWTGYGVWAQLVASWALPFAWACSWRAVSERRAWFPAVALVALTVALHFETGYLALGGVVVIGLVADGRLVARLGRAAVVTAGAVLASAWVLLPVVVSAPWAARNQVLAHTALEDGYGAKQILSWLFTGRLYDAGRLPVISVLLAVGLVTAVVHARRRPVGVALVALGAVSLVLSFGRTTFGSLTVLIPGGADLFMRRFGMGAQLAGLYLAGMGAVTVARGVTTWATVVLPRYRIGRQVGVAGALGVVGVVALWPLVGQLDGLAGQNAAAVASQRASDRGEAADVDRLLAYVKEHGGGRVYAGMPNNPDNWGSRFTIGAVPVSKYLEAADVDEVGYTLRTASLMTDPEYYFDEANPGDYALFGIRYLLLPVWEPPPVPATLVLAAGGDRLYVLPANGYVRVVDTVGVLSADRTDVGGRAAAYLDSALPGQGRYLAVAWAGDRAAPRTATVAPGAGPAGTVLSTDSALPDGMVRTSVVAQRRAVVVLSASYDPGWVAEVDGKRAATEMVAPALVGVAVLPGHHDVVFRYQGYQGYPALFALAGAVALITLAVDARARRRARQ